MKANVVALAVLAVPLLGAAPQPTDSAPGAWLHVRVEEAGQNSRVHVNLPLPVVEAVLKAAPEAIGSQGRIGLRGHRIHLGGREELSVAQLREAWSQLKAAGDGEIVSVDSDDEAVRVAREGDQVRVRVEGRGKDKQSVRVDVPLSLVDALLSSGTDELDVQAAISELTKLRGDIVRVTDEDSSVHVWIDERAGSQTEK